MAINNIPPFKIGNLEMFLIQGGMGVGVSQSELASAVADEGGAGIIASVGLGILKGYFYEEIKQNRDRIARAGSKPEKDAIIAQIYARCNQIALKEEIGRAMAKTNGVIGVNIMHALSDYSALVQASVEAGVRLISSGAGVPRDLPKYLQGKNIMLVPIAASARLAVMIYKAWTKLGHPPDAVIVEGPMAGGHLGYGRYNPADPSFTEHLDNPEFVANGLERIVKEVIQALAPFAIGSRKIPVIAAGGIFYGGDLRRYVEIGAAGGQMATRLVPTFECDASQGFKDEYLACKKEDLVLINSPVGMPGRAIRNKFLDDVGRGLTSPFSCPYHCLKTCNPATSPYCIAKALTQAQQGKFTNGYVFAGSNAYRCKEMLSVKDLMAKLDDEYARNVVCD